MHELMKEFFELLPSDIRMQYKFYADDLIIICQHKHTKKIIQTLRAVSENFNLIINNAKSGILPIKHLNDIIK